MKIDIQFPPKAKERWTPTSPNPYIESIIGKSAKAYKDSLKIISKYMPELLMIPAEKSDEVSPFWNNDFLSGLDAASLYAFISHYKPNHYLEIGSGNSTKFAKAAISKHGLDTKITAIDPAPRSEVGDLVDAVFGFPFEELNTDQWAAALNENDIVFFDGSHHTLQNSDATVFFLEFLPQLKPGVIVGVHDILLPYDYPEHWLERNYSEQYLLGAYLLGGAKIKPLLAAAYVSVNDSVFKSSEMWPEGMQKHGCAYWFRT